MNFDLLATELTEDEAFRSYPYDDATGQQLRAGDTIRGNITFGTGFTFLTAEEARAVLDIRMRSVFAQLTAKLPWLESASDPIQRALTNMAFNLGVEGLLGFVTFLRFVQNREYAQAADDLMRTKWAGQVGARAGRIAQSIRTG